MDAHMHLLHKAIATKTAESLKASTTSFSEATAQRKEATQNLVQLEQARMRHEMQGHEHTVWMHRRRGEQV